MTVQAVRDRRAALKSRHRTAILNAADSLINERSAPRFSVDELAERADVSRRTIFNHFPSLDDVVMTACSLTLIGAVDEFRAATAATPAGDGSQAALFAEIADALRGIDLPSVVAYFWRVLGTEDDGGRSSHMIQNVFTRTIEQLSIEAAARSGEVDQLNAEILVSSVMNGIAIIAAHWIRLTGAVVDDSSRQAWNELLERLIANVRVGYARSS